MYEQCDEKANSEGNTIGCFGIVSNEEESKGMNMQNCVANKNCLVAVSFQHCYRETDGDINFDCKDNLPESKRDGREGVVRVMLQADMRCLFQKFYKEINISFCQITPLFRLLF